MLFDLFALQFQLRCTCPSWKHSETVLLYEDGDPSVLSNYRPIGLSNCISKLWTAYLSETLHQYCHVGGLLSDTQAGFRADRRCLHQLLYVTTLFEEDSATAKENLYVTYIDLKTHLEAWTTAASLRLCVFSTCRTMPSASLLTSIQASPPLSAFPPV
jgi:hypothetical protein